MDDKDLRTVALDAALRVAVPLEFDLKQIVFAAGEFYTFLSSPPQANTASSTSSLLRETSEGHFIHD